MAVTRCLHDKSFYDAEWKNEIKEDFLNFVERFLGNISNEKFSYPDLEEEYVNHLKSTGCFDWEDDDKELKEDEWCEGTYEDEIYNLLDSIEFDLLKILNDRKENNLKWD